MSDHDHRITVGLPENDLHGVRIVVEDGQNRSSATIDLDLGTAREVASAIMEMTSNQGLAPSR